MWKCRDNWGLVHKREFAAAVSSQLVSIPNSQDIHCRQYPLAEVGYQGLQVNVFSYLRRLPLVERGDVNR